ncbi:MAG TPA: family 10 glycosylhydrolase [Candidatus Koribacter sp.]|jgi:hypothetical protein
MIRKIFVGFATLVAASFLCAQAPDYQQNWTNYVRIGAYGLEREDPAKIVADATASDVFGIEVDNDIEGRYESFLDPTEKLAAIKSVAEKAHAANNYAFVYIAGTECITANADQTAHTLAKDHPDWLQRKITGEPAIFSAEAAFWIAKGDEDVWVSPYAPEWRKIYMHHVAQIAATGIDGIYVDIPYWMTHFTGWEDTWASFDQYTVAEFKKQTGLDAKKDLKLGDFSDPNFQKWVDFRIQTFTDFMAEIASTAKAVNPKIKIIPEIYPGFEQEAVRVGADVYSMYAVVDAIAHEYEFGEGDHMASSRSQIDWFNYQVGMHTFRAFAEGKATWILNYSWDGDKNVKPSDAMKNLAMSQVMDGANFWDAPGHSMAGSNDLATRKEIFHWIAAHEKTFYLPRTALHPVGVYFSAATRNRTPEEFVRAYRGVLILLIQAHREFQVVTPRTLDQFKGGTLVLPDARAFDEHEQNSLKAYVKSGRELVVTGTQPEFLADATNVVRFRESVGEQYYRALETSFADTKVEGEKDFLNSLGAPTDLTIEAASTVATSISRVGGATHIFMANFTGLVPHELATPTKQNVTIRVHGRMEKAEFLPFLGDTLEIRGKRQGEDTVFTLPEIERGAVFWYPANSPQ